MGCSISEPIYPPNQLGVRNSRENLAPGTIKVPLTEREVFQITKSWRTISSNMVNAGITMFLRMFETRAEVKAMFEQFRTVDKMTDLYTNSSLENHALIVMNALDEAITNLDDDAYLVDFLLVTGKSHQRFENFSASVFWAIEDPFLTAVRQTLGSKFSGEIERSYAKAIRFILNTLIIGFNQRDRNLSSAGESNGTG